MERDEIRLECLKLCTSVGRDLTETLARAKAYEDFVVGHSSKASETTPAAKPGSNSKKNGNADILS